MYIKLTGSINKIFKSTIVIILIANAFNFIFIIHNNTGKIINSQGDITGVTPSPTAAS
jgi:hypothetical protein